MVFSANFGSVLRSNTSNETLPNWGGTPWAEGGSVGHLLGNVVVAGTGEEHQGWWGAAQSKRKHPHHHRQSRSETPWSSGYSVISPKISLPFGRGRDQLSVTQKHLNRTQRPAGSEEGRGAETQQRPTSQKSPCSDSGEETTERPWFHGMRTAGNGNKGLALSRVGWSVESVMKRIFKRIREIRGMRTTARLRL